MEATVYIVRKDCVLMHIGTLMTVVQCLRCVLMMVMDVVNFVESGCASTGMIINSTQMASAVYVVVNGVLSIEEVGTATATTMANVFIVERSSVMAKTAVINLLKTKMVIEYARFVKWKSVLR